MFRINISTLSEGNKKSTHHLFMPPTNTTSESHFRLSVTKAISLGTQKRTLRLEVPTPVVVMTEAPEVVLFIPRRKRVPYCVFLTGV